MDKERLRKFIQGESNCNGGMNMTDVISFIKTTKLYSKSLESYSRSELQQFVNTHFSELTSVLPSSVKVKAPEVKVKPSVSADSFESVIDKAPIVPDFDLLVDEIDNILHIIYGFIKERRGVYEKKYGKSPATTELLTIELCKQLNKVFPQTTIPIHKYITKRMETLLTLKELKELKFKDFKTLLIKTIPFLNFLTPNNCVFGAGGGTSVMDEFEDIIMPHLFRQLENVKHEKVTELLGSLKVHDSSLKVKADKAEQQGKKIMIQKK
jgi:hypothetical protein